MGGYRTMTGDCWTMVTRRRTVMGGGGAVV